MNSHRMLLCDSLSIIYDETILKKLLLFLLWLSLNIKLSLWSKKFLACNWMNLFSRLARLYSHSQIITILLTWGLYLFLMKSNFLWVIQFSWLWVLPQQFFLVIESNPKKNIFLVLSFYLEGYLKNLQDTRRENGKKSQKGWKPFQIFLNYYIKVFLCISLKKLLR